MPVLRTARRFCGLCSGALDMLASQKRFILCAPDARRDRPAIDRDPTHFLNDVSNYLPSLPYAPEGTRSRKGLSINDQVPGAAMISYPEPRRHLGDDADYYWFDCTIYARVIFAPGRPAALDPVFTFTAIFAANARNHKAFEIMSPQLDNHWLTTSPAEQNWEEFSAGLLSAFSDQLLLPRLKTTFRGFDQLGSVLPFAVAVAGISDHRSRGSVLMEPPL